MHDVRPALERALPFVVLVLLLAASMGCSKIPQGRSAVDSVRILDAKNVKASDTEDKLETEASTKFLFLFQGVAFDYSVYDEAVLQRDMARVERFYRSKGFLDAHARVARVIKVHSNHVRIEIVVDEGPPTLNRNLVIVGLEGLPKDIAGEVTTAAKGAIVKGARFDEKSFKDSEAAVKKSLTDRGYAYATVESQAELDIGEHAVDYGFNVAAGPLSFFGPITITGLDPDGDGPRTQEIPEAPLRRAIDIKQGTPYSTAQIDSATQALLDLEVFSAVQIVPTLANPPPPDHVVPLAVKVEPTRLRQITLGGGVEIDEIKTDIHLVTGWENHNFLGGLRDFSAIFRPGAVLYPVRIDNLKGPVQPLPEEFPLLVEVNPPADAPVVGYREFKLPLGVDRTFWKKLFVSLDYTFQVENPFGYVGAKDESLETLFLSFPELVTHLDFRDNSIRPHLGIYLGNTFQVAGHVFGGTASDVRVQPEVRTYLPIAHGVTFATRASVGFLFASNYGKHPGETWDTWDKELENSANPEILAQTSPPSPARVDLAHDEQIMYFRGFFSGGPTTNRGYPILGVAPHGVIPFLNPATASQQVQFGCDPAEPQNFNKQDQCFLPVGGFTLWEFQNEVRFDISGPLSASVFCDMSDVSPNQGDIRLSHLHLSCGVGAAYDTPVGPIRVNLGYRVEPLQVLGFKDESDASNAAAGGDPVNGTQPRIFGQPIAIAIGIGQAY